MKMNLSSIIRVSMIEIFFGLIKTNNPTTGYRSNYNEIYRQGYEKIKFHWNLSDLLLTSTETKYIASPSEELPIYSHNQDRCTFFRQYSHSYSYSQ